MRCASGASYAIAFEMVLLSLVCLPRVPGHVHAGAADDSAGSGSPDGPSPSPPTPRTTAGTGFSASPPPDLKSPPTSSDADAAAAAPGSGGYAGSGNAANFESSTPRARTAQRPIRTTITTSRESVRPTTTASDLPQSTDLVYRGSLLRPTNTTTATTKAGGVIQVLSSTTRPTTESPGGECDTKCNNVMARKQGICGCNASTNAKRPFLKSGLTRSALERYRQPTTTASTSTSNNTTIG